MKRIPRAAVFDSTIPLLTSGGYHYISDRCAELGTDIFETRMLLRPAICMVGANAAELFYDQDKFIRRGAVPNRILHSLLGKGGVHGLDDGMHRNRKRMFMSLMDEESLARLSRITRRVWSEAIIQWENQERVILFQEAQQILCRAICEWSGIPLPEKDVRRRAQDLTAMVDAFGGVGPRYWKGRLARKRTEAWIEDIVKQVRSRELSPSSKSAAYVIAFHRSTKGKLLSREVAAVELINVVRPTVAVAYLIAFSALAVHQYPEHRERLEDDDGALENFVQEIRRFYPFAPAMGAMTSKSFNWQGYHFPKGRLVILDLYGTNHDPRSWDNPDEFRPERFRHWDGSPFNFIPQGGGDHFGGHRCAGEWLTIDQLKIALKFLVREIRYDVPEQDLRYSMMRMPTFPQSGFVISGVRQASGPAIADAANA